MTVKHDATADNPETESIRDDKAEHTNAWYGPEVMILSMTNITC